MVSTGQFEVEPSAARGAPASGGEPSVPIMRAIVSLEQSSLTKEVGEGLKRRNS